MMADTRASDGSQVPGGEQAAIEIESLVARFGRKRAVDGLSLTILSLARCRRLLRYGC